MKNLLLIAIITLFLGCKSKNNEEMNGNWQSEIKPGSSYEELKIKIDKNSIFVTITKNSPQIGLERPYVDVKELSGKFIENNKYELSNGAIIEYNRDIDVIYLKSNSNGKEFFRLCECNISKTTDKEYENIAKLIFNCIDENNFGKLEEKFPKAPTIFYLNGEKKFNFSLEQYNEITQKIKNDISIFSEIFAENNFQIESINIDNNSVKTTEIDVILINKSTKKYKLHIDDLIFCEEKFIMEEIRLEEIN